MLSLGFCYFTVLIDIDVSRFLLNVLWQRRPKRTVFSRHFNYFATLYSVSGKRENHYFVSQKHTSTLNRQKGQHGESRYLMLNLPLFTVGCLNKRVLKLENSIMTHDPQVFEMEQQDLFWKRIRDVLWAHCLYLDVIWTKISFSFSIMAENSRV